MAPKMDEAGTPLRPLPLNELEAILPKLDKAAPGVEITIQRFETLMDSSSMTPRDWVKIAEEIEDVYDSYDGFVVIQGTDTLSYTASALSFMFENLDKPVVITGSQLPLVSARTDATNNYIHAVMVAAYDSSDLPKVPEVVVVFGDKILRGCRTRKMSASAMAGFDSPNCPPLGEVRERIFIYENRIRKVSYTSDFQVNTQINENVLDISIFPGFRAEDLRAILSLPKLQGVIFRTYGSGNGPEDDDFLNALSKASDKVVVNITQCPQGMVEMGLYAASVGFIEKGMISGLDMTPEAAMAKLMLTLGSQVEDEVKLQMQISQRGEQSMNLFDFEFDSPQKISNTPWSGVVTPDRRFSPGDLERVVLRISSLSIGTGDEKEGHIDVYMNRPNADQDDAKKAEHPRRILRIPVDKNEARPIIEQISVRQVRNIIGDSNVTLTMVPSKGIQFSFEKLSLGMFTIA